MSMARPEIVAQNFNAAIAAIRDYDHFRKQQGSMSKAEDRLRGAVKSIYESIDSILTSYRSDLRDGLSIKRLNSGDESIIKANNIGLQNLLKVARIYTKLKNGIDISSVDFELIEIHRQLRNDIVHPKPNKSLPVPSYDAVIALVETTRNLLNIYFQGSISLNPIKKPKIKRKVRFALDSAKKGKYLSPESIDILSSGNADREVEVPELPSPDKIAEDPVFCCFIFDASGSMMPQRQAVIDSHPVLLDTLRKSAKCRTDSLYVIQYTFSSSAVMLNPFEKLDANKNDNVMALDINNYNPSGSTALYQTIHKLLQDMAVSIDACEKDGIASTFTIAVITDGEDTEGGVYPAQIKSVITELRNRGCLRKSIVLGLLGQSFSRQQLENIKNILGFDEATSLENDPKAIRRAFQMASQSSIS